MARNGYQMFETQAGKKIKKHGLVMLLVIIMFPWLLLFIIGGAAQGGFLHLNFGNWLCVMAASYLIWRRY